jgi:hypothetical protein
MQDLGDLGFVEQVVQRLGALVELQLRLVDVQREDLFRG